MFAGPPCYRGAVLSPRGKALAEEPIGALGSRCPVTGMAVLAAGLHNPTPFPRPAWGLALRGPLTLQNM